MEIKTKFNAGDKIFTVKNLGEWIVYPCVIIQVQIKIDRHLDYGDEDRLVKIFYVCLSGDYLLEIPEKECFTYKEAQAECDKRNYETEYKQIFEKCLDEAIEKTVSEGE